MESFLNSEMWDLVKLPIGINHVSRKWVFKKKMNATSQVEKFKSQLVVKGYSQVEGVGFSEIYSPIAQLNSIRVLMYLAETFHLEIEHMDVNIAFLHRDLEEKIYMK